MLGYTYFTWKDSVTTDGAHSVATQYYIEESQNGSDNWTSLPLVNAETAKTTFANLPPGDAFAIGFPKQLLADQGVNRLERYSHGRKNWYRIHAVDAEGDISPTTDPFRAGSHPEDSAIQASATTQSSGEIALTWGARVGRTYNVLRRDLGSTGTFAAPASTAAGITAGSYVDSTTVAGSGYEYLIIESSGVRTYLVAGRNLAAVEDRGKIVLLVDDSVAGALRGYIARLQSDLVGDGWTVLRHNVYRNQKVTGVRKLIRDDFDAFALPGNKSEVKQVLLLGHVPVPYSGSGPADGHTSSNAPPSHVGALATDAYYADMTGTWTDTADLAPPNTPPDGFTDGGVGYSNMTGDGRFDQNNLFGEFAPELAVGRVDMYDLPSATTIETDPLKREVELLKRYLRKDHEYRVGAWDVRKRAIVYSNFEFPGRSTAPSAYTNLSALVGSNNVDAGNYFPANQNHLTPGAANNSYILGWADGAGYDFTQFWGAGFATSDGGGAAQFLSDATSPDVIFNQLYGSYFADWDRQNNFLRAAIAGNGYGLTSTSALGSAPKFWHMGMGETIGENTLFTQRGQPSGGLVDRSTALMGDPTLRMAVVKPPTEVHAAPNGQGGVFVAWEASADPSVVGYRVYRASSMDGPFIDVSGDVGAENSFFFDESGNNLDIYGNVSDIYMVRAVKLEQSNTGTYCNLSQGAFSEVRSGVTVGIGRTSRAYVGTVAFTFTEPVDVDSGAVTLQRRGPDGEPINENFALSTDDGGLSYIVTLPNSLGQPIPFGDGVYDLSVNSAGVNLANTAIVLNEAQRSYMFFRYAGDADGDGGVSINDFNILAGGFGAGNDLDADSDNDGGISINDFNELAARFGTSVWSLLEPPGGGV